MRWKRNFRTGMKTTVSSHGRVESIFQGIISLEVRSSLCIMILSLRDTRDGTKLWNLSHGTTGGQESAETSDNMSKAARNAKRLSRIEPNQLDRYIHMTYQANPGR